MTLRKLSKFSFLVTLVNLVLSFDFIVPRASFFKISNAVKPSDENLAKHIVFLTQGNASGIFGTNHLCGGTIISESIILTAAHCIVDSSGYMKAKDQLLVVAGTPNRLEKTEFTQIHEIERMMPFPYYDARRYKDDIALLFLARPLIEDGIHIQRIELQKSQPLPNRVCVIFGWGAILPDGPKPNQVLFTNTTLLRPENCFESYRFTRGFLCASIEGGLGLASSAGDSGGPFICDGLLVGVVSYGMDFSMLSFFADVAYYSDWIALNESAVIRTPLLWVFLVICFTAMFVE